MSEEIETRLGQRSMNPLDLMELRRAITKKASTVKLAGKLYDLSYEGDKVFFRVQYGFTPCGWTSLKHINEQLMAMEVIEP